MRKILNDVAGRNRAYGIRRHRRVCLTCISWRLCSTTIYSATVDFAPSHSPIHTRPARTQWSTAHNSGHNNQHFIRFGCNAAINAISCNETGDELASKSCLFRKIRYKLANNIQKKNSFKSAKTSNKRNRLNNFAEI